MDRFQRGRNNTIKRIESICFNKVLALSPPEGNLYDERGILKRQIYIEVDGEDLAGKLVSMGRLLAIKDAQHPNRERYLQLQREAQKKGRGWWARHYLSDDGRSMLRPEASGAS